MPPSTPDTPYGDLRAESASLEASASPSAHSERTQHGSHYHHPGGVTVYSPGAAASAVLNPRSCVTCRRRKVRCDKHMPCSNCKRAQIPCVFPAPGRAPRRPRPKDPNAPPKQPSSEREVELMKRLRKLEGIVEELSGQIEVEARHNSSAGNSAEAPVGTEGDVNTSGSAGPTDAAASVSGGSSRSHYSPGLGGSTKGSPGAGHFVSGFSTSLGPVPKPTADMNKHFGRLVLNEGGNSRYVSSVFWSRLTDEIEEIKAEARGLTDDELGDSDNESTPDVPEQDRSAADHQSFILGYRSADVDLRPLHPLPSQIPFMWQMYQENVDPICKILHVPTMNKLIRDVRTNMDVLTPSTEALMFSIYYAAITSMEEDEVKTNFCAEKNFLIAQYRFALEQALAKANFLTSSDLVTCQAFTLFLLLVRRHDDTRFSWTLTGLAIRIGQSLGLHRDGAHFGNLTPFEIEMRRRLFWAIAMLDLRSAEDQGTDLTIVERTFDTQLPLNINDADISPETVEMPEPREGTTDLTFSLIRYEICALGRRLHNAASASATICPRDAAATIEEREEMLLGVYDRVENNYLKDSSGESNPMFWVAANIARVIVAKMTLNIYQPVIFPGPGHDLLSNERRQRLFTAAIEIFEYGQMLNTDPRCKQWRWLFQTYTQWHAVAYLLIECSHRPWSATIERAWTALNSIFYLTKHADLARMTDHTAVWLPFRKLFAKVRKHREAEIARLKADPQAALQLDLDDLSNAPPSTFSALPGSIKSAVARERWCKLVNAPSMPPDAAAPGQRNLDGLSLASQPAQRPSALTQTLRDEHDTNLDIVDEAMRSSTFQPDQLWPVAFSTAGSAELARSSIFGLRSGDDVPRQDGVSQPVGGLGSHTGLGSSSAYQPTFPPAKNDNPPPYLWSADDLLAEPGNEAAGLGLGEGSRFADIQVDDMDVNMDEGFDWQNWHESIRGFEMASGGATGGVWGNGI